MMLKWLIGWLKRNPSREIQYFYVNQKGSRSVLIGYATTAMGIHLIVTPLGTCPIGHHMVAKEQAVDQKHWQELWNEFNKAKKIEWET